MFIVFLQNTPKYCDSIVEEALWGSKWTFLYGRGVLM